MYLCISIQLRNIVRYSTLLPGATPPLSTEEDTKKESNVSEFPDFSTLPQDTSSIPPNSPYYLYNPEPSMTKNYIKKIASTLKKKELMKMASKLKKASKTMPTQEQTPANPISQPAKKSKFKFSLLDTNALPHRVAVDLSFSHLMNPLEMRSTGVQLINLLSQNTTSHTPLQVHITNYQGCIQDHILNLKKKMKPEQAHLSPFHFTEVFKRNEVVYLSAESDTVLQRVDPSLVYIIGGLADARRDIKGASLQAATDAGVRHARLPLREIFISCIPRPLPINIVYGLLSNFIRSNSWLQAITDTIHPNNFLAFKVRQPLGTHAIPSDLPNNPIRSDF